MDRVATAVGGSSVGASNGGGSRSGGGGGVAGRLTAGDGGAGLTAARPRRRTLLADMLAVLILMSCLLSLYRHPRL